jgi:glycine betaine transporter
MLRLRVPEGAQVCEIARHATARRTLSPVRQIDVRGKPGQAYWHADCSARSEREEHDMELNTLLVPLDFSPISAGVFQAALELVRGDDAALILLHAIDPALVDFAAGLEVEPREKIIATMRGRAEDELAALKQRAAGRVDVQTIVSEGIPFLEILRKAEDFQVDAILMGKHGMRGQIEKMLFGTTAERVIRGTLRAVIVIPVDDA